MRISEMTTEQAFECMARMVPYVTEIERDQEVVNVKEKLREAAKQEDGDLTTGDVIEAAMPLILGKHRNAFFGILGALEGKKPEEIAKQPYAQTVAAVKADLTKEFFDFLPSAARLVSNA